MSGLSEVCSLQERFSCTRNVSSALGKALVQPEFFKVSPIMYSKRPSQSYISKSLSVLPYEDRLISLQLRSLYCCRQRGDLIETFKVIHNFTTIDLETAFILSTSQPTRGHPFKLTKRRYNWELRKHFFTNWVINQWNSRSLPINSFKLKLDNYWSLIRYGQNQRPVAYYI